MKWLLGILGIIGGFLGALFLRRGPSREALQAHDRAQAAGAEAEIHAGELVEAAEELEAEAIEQRADDLQADEQLIEEAVEASEEIRAPRGSAPRPRSSVLDEMRERWRQADLDEDGGGG